MTDEKKIPEWIERENLQKAEEGRQADELSQQQLKDSLPVQEFGPNFWKQLVERLAFNVEALGQLIGKDDEKIIGSISQTFGSELGCRIDINRQSVKYYPMLSHMSLFYRPGGDWIRRWYQDREMDHIGLQSNGDSRVVAFIDSEGPLTAQQLADHIVETMVDAVRVKTSF